MNSIELRKLVGDQLISRAANEEVLAIQLVAKNPAHLMGLVQQMQKATNEPEKRRIFAALSRDEQLAFVFLASDPKAAQKVRNYLHRNT